MIIDATPFSETLQDSLSTDFRTRAYRAVVDFIESRLGVRVVKDRASVPYGREDLQDIWELAADLKESGVLSSFYPVDQMPDLVPLKAWGALTGGSAHMVGGATFASDRNALMAALAECLERYLWLEEIDHFVRPITKTIDDMKKRNDTILPERFSSFSPEQRKKNPKLAFAQDTEFLWIQADSLVSGKKIYLPAQTISGVGQGHPIDREPLIRERTTIGLATWPDTVGARLAGALEVIERESYMIMWLNQLTMPKVELEALAHADDSLKAFLAVCARYRFKIHAIHMPTDAPTHAICVVVEDESGSAPRFTVGLRAHRSLSDAVTKALTEALRARSLARYYDRSKDSLSSAQKEAMGHQARSLYWADPAHQKHLEFLVRGSEKDSETAEWDADSAEEHLARIVEWCRVMGFECASVSLGTSKKNPTPLHVEMVIIPELQPTYLAEKNRQLGGTRWREVPTKLGYPVRKSPFTDVPHPFI